MVVVSSRWEARSLVVQEAMRAGVPVVATAVGGIPELVGDAAVLVAPASRAMSFCTMAQLAAERASLSASLVVVSVSAEASTVTALLMLS